MLQVPRIDNGVDKKRRWTLEAAIIFLLRRRRNERPREIGVQLENGQRCNSRNTLIIRYIYINSLKSVRISRRFGYLEQNGKCDRLTWLVGWLVRKGDTFEGRSIIQFFVAVLHYTRIARILFQNNRASRISNFVKVQRAVCQPHVHYTLFHENV